MRILTVASLTEFQRHLRLAQPGVILETDLDVVETECDHHSRRRRDAEVLTTLAANLTGDCLDLGTSHGHSAFKLATNLAGRGTVHTVNILPEQYQSTSGQLVTHLLTREQIGAFYRERGTAGIRQIYADTCNWQMPPDLRDLGLVFVDAAHDTETVFKDSVLIAPRVRPGGFVVWHDFNPGLRHKFGWIDAVMRGVEEFFRALRFEPEILHLKDSWMGVWQIPNCRSRAGDLQSPPEATSTPTTHRENNVVGRSGTPSAQAEAGLPSTASRLNPAQAASLPLHEPVPAPSSGRPPGAAVGGGFRVTNREPWRLVGSLPVGVQRGAEERFLPPSRIEVTSPFRIPHSHLRNLKFALVYPAYSAGRVAEEAGLAARLSRLGYHVEAHGIPCVGGWWPFPKLDQKWRTGSADLMSRYGELADKLRGVDVLIAAGGSMLHPEFIRQLGTYNVFICADDPENSAVLSQPVAAAFDFSCVANIACVSDYARWGVRHAAWLPLPVSAHVIDRTLSEERLRTGTRDVDLVMCCERVYGLSDRAQRLERLQREFPQAILRGKGWPDGFVTDAELRSLYRRARIGWNLHNSTGPVNTRLMMLPAFGVMQLCDCKSHLGHVFKLGEEVIGFDTMDECVDATRYYLAHEDERRRIAIAGWKRVLADYTEEKWWQRLLGHIAPHLPAAALN